MNQKYINELKVKVYQLEVENKDLQTLLDLRSKEIRRLYTKGLAIEKALAHYIDKDDKEARHEQSQY